MTDGTYDDAKAERWPSPKGREEREEDAVTDVMLDYAKTLCAGGHTGKEVYAITEGFRDRILARLRTHSPLRGQEDVPDVRPDDWPSGKPYPGEYAGIRGFLMELLAEVYRNKWRGDEPEFSEAFEQTVWLLSTSSLRTHSPEEPVGWQPIETAPEYTGVLVAWDDGRRRVCRGARQRDGSWWNLGAKLDTPTHWMPLPDPPIGQPLDPEDTDKEEDDD